MTLHRANLPIDKLARPDAMIEVMQFRNTAIGEGADGARDPHRHDYHELLWVCSGEGHHRIDGAVAEFTPGSVTIIGRGQVHVLERGVDMVGAVIRFREEMLADCGGLAWILHTPRCQVATVPPSDSTHMNALVSALTAELTRPPDGASLDVERHLLATILLLVERWLEASQAERPVVADNAIQLHRRFSAQLEADYARHHDAAHYAQELRVPAAALSRALVEASGRTTKELISDRVMLEASRLLLFSDLTIGEIAYRTGFRDQLYFSRAFKRNRGAAPSDYRAAQRRENVQTG
jgi:AraC family transcriptional activator of pobA